MKNSFLKLRSDAADASEIAPITADPRYAAEAQKLDDLLDRLAETRQRRDFAAARARGDVVTGRNVMDRARDLLAGGIVPGMNPEAEREACAEEERILMAAIVQQRAVVEDIAGDLSLEICRGFREVNARVHRTWLEAMAQMAAARDELLTLHAALRNAGYSVNSSALPSCVPHVVYQLGAADRYDSHIKQLARWIEANL